MFRRWKVLPKVAAANSSFIEQMGEIGPLAGEILIKRGVTSLEAIHSSGLADPFLIKDMDKAVEAISAALEEGRKITVYGDYDCDGVCSVAILYSYLEAMGADVDYYIPDRFSEGYGLNVKALEKLIAQGTELVITVDNGISALKEAEYLREQGIELVVTDHHQPSETLPECAACVNPHRADDTSPFTDLCGAGVALMLCIALEGDEEFILDRYSDLAAVATIGDVVPLKAENRFIVRKGLEYIRNEQNAGLTRLIRAAKREPASVTSTDLAFYIVPKINAAGRIDTAEKALRLLLCEDDGDAAATLTEQLMSLNSERQQIGETILSEAKALIAENPLIAKQRVIVLAKQGWHSGVVGIVCSKLLEEYGKPVVMISVDGNKASGSMRSIEGFSAYKMLAACSDLLTKFGGHTAAGGFSLSSDKIEEFTAKVYEYSRENFPKMPEYSLYADMDITADMLSVQSVYMLSALEPFGEGNEMPLFRLKNCVVSGKTPRGEGRFTAMKLNCGNTVVSAISFSVPYLDFYPNNGDSIDVIVTAEINEYNNNRSVQLKIVDFRPSAFDEDRYFAAMRVYEEICRGEGCDKRLLLRVLPQTREQLMYVYDLVRSNSDKTADMLFVISGGVNYCQLMVILTAFIEAGMVVQSEQGRLSINPTPQKSDLFAAGGYLDKLKQSLS